MKIKLSWEKTKRFIVKVFNRAKEMNPFLVVAIIFAIYFVLPPLSGEYSVWNQIKTGYDLSKSRNEHERLTREIEESRKDLEELQLHKDMLEKYAREKFLMKSENEDLYLLK